MLGLMYAKKHGKDLPGNVLYYLLAMKEILRQVPVVEEISSLGDEISKSVTTKESWDKVALNVLDGTIDWTSARVVPALVGDIAKMTDEYDRWTDGTGWGRLQKRIPGLRNRLEVMENQFGDKIETPDPLWSLFAGGRVKNDLSNQITDEYSKLLDEKAMPSLTDVEDWVRFEQAKEQLGEEKYQQAFKEFQLSWKNNTLIMINSDDYKSLTAEEKKKELDDMRGDVANDVLEKYGYEYKGKEKEKKEKTPLDLIGGSSTASKSVLDLIK
jgi:hypothetical protein